MSIHRILSFFYCTKLNQWLKCNGIQGNAVPPPPIHHSKRSPTSDCYNARERHTTIVGGPNLNVAFPTSNFLHFNHWIKHNITDTDMRGVSQVLSAMSFTATGKCFVAMYREAASALRQRVADTASTRARLPWNCNTEETWSSERRQTRRSPRWPRRGQSLHG